MAVSGQSSTSGSAGDSVASPAGAKAPHERRKFRGLRSGLFRAGERADVRPHAVQREAHVVFQSLPLILGRPFDVLPHAALHQRERHGHALGGKTPGHDGKTPRAEGGAHHQHERGAARKSETRLAGRSAAEKSCQPLAGQAGRRGQKSGIAVLAEHAQRLHEHRPGSQSRREREPGKPGAEPAPRPLQKIPHTSRNRSAPPRRNIAHSGHDPRKHAAPEGHVHAEQYGTGRGQKPGKISVLVRGHGNPVEGRRRAGNARRPARAERRFRAGGQKQHRRIHQHDKRQMHRRVGSAQKYGQRTRRRKRGTTPQRNDHG